LTAAQADCPDDKWLALFRFGHAKERSRVKLNLSARAALIWLPEGETPTADKFGPSIYSVEEALERIREASPKVPWIQTEEITLDPVQIAQAQMGLRLMRSHN
jgi:hypothetical protein